VLNAFRHHRGGHRFIGSRPDREFRCSTPFGITEVGIDDARFCPPMPTGCSTPFGITEVGIRRGVRSIVVSGCAQRLSASQRWASGPTAFVAGERQGCSTPFGITEVGISLESARWMFGSGAQRLSASQRWACRARENDRAPDPVLNAFRHHRGGHPSGGGGPASLDECSTPFGITEVGMGGRARGYSRSHAVLNAFRHHRGGHRSRRRATSAFSGGCSTPFGITEVGICTRPRLKPGVDLVLNAFRHHRGGHGGRRVRIGIRIKCSTPFGITEVGINCFRRDSDQCFVCSTPFGITEVGIRRLVGGPRPNQDVLNAFRHHRGGHQPCMLQPILL